MCEIRFSVRENVVEFSVWILVVLVIFSGNFSAILVDCGGGSVSSGTKCIFRQFFLL